ncbi:hypothetical protein EDE12_106174 [Methylosinus sp. sav-2]|uniref:hypothetical protein n=1 Tax=Methylosinus sp. sav-2 TaxID=2485168 RepID=UPI000479962F|nr:hypothetical protein [Methylosinus sp. sav-2]TDX64028.1 hypothetical protein EDE12_106174 [Methylosinus sp. sav-2]
MSPDDFTKPPRPHGPRERLAAASPARRRDTISCAARPVPEIRAISKERPDALCTSRRYDGTPTVTVSLPRLAFLEKDVR